MKGENTLSETTLKARLKHATKTEAEWKTANPVLLEGEVAYSSDKRQQKTGDGTSTWSVLSYDSAIPTSHEHDLSTMINKLGVGEATPTDKDYYVSQYVGGGTTTTSYHRRPMSALFEYIKSKFGTAATKNISDFASAKHNHNIESLTNFNQRVYDAASTRKKGTFLAAPATADGTASFRTLAETDVINAFARTVMNSGYAAMAYANKDWFENKIYSGNLFSSCKIWLAQYRNTEYTYGGRVNMWQYTSKGRVDGINGDVDISAWVY